MELHAVPYCSGVGWGLGKEVQQPDHIPLPCPDTVQVYRIDFVKVVKAADGNHHIT